MAMTPRPEWRDRGARDAGPPDRRNGGGSLLKVETQNVNVPACRFYAAQGCVLGEIRRFAYAEFPHETELVRCRFLDAGERPAAAEALAMETRER